MKRFFLLTSLLLASFTLAASFPAVRQRVFKFVAAAQTQTATTQRTTPARRVREPLENFDIRADLNRSLIAPPDEPTANQSQARRQTESAVQDLLTAHPRTVIRWSSLTGTPSRIANLSEALTPPSQAGAEARGRTFLKEQSALFRLRDDEVDGLKTRRQDRTPHNGLERHQSLRPVVHRSNASGRYVACDPAAAS